MVVVLTDGSVGGATDECALVDRGAVADVTADPGTAAVETFRCVTCVEAGREAAAIVVVVVALVLVVVVACAVGLPATFLRFPRV